MPSQSATQYLERQQIIPTPYGAGQHQVGALHSHRRPITPVPELLEADTPRRRVYTVPMEQRVAFKRKEENGPD